MILGLLGLLLAKPLLAETVSAHQCRLLIPAKTTDNIARQPGRRPATVVIIIDDLGHQLDQGEAVIKLPGKLNLAVIPHTPHARKLANAAHLAGKEILLHAPMSNTTNKPLGAGALTPQMSEQIFRDTLTDALSAVPHVRGVNNHMGSDLTQRHLQMSWLMQELAERQLYFVDSRTSKLTVAAHTATEFDIPNLSRQVFLDNDRDPEAIAERFHHVVQIAVDQGLAVAIGHPYPETISYLAEVLPHLERLGVELAYISEAVVMTEAAATTPAQEAQPVGP